MAPSPSVILLPNNVFSGYSALWLLRPQPVSSGSLRLYGVWQRKLAWQDMISKANWTDFSGVAGSNALTTLNRTSAPLGQPVAGHCDRLANRQNHLDARTCPGHRGFGHGADRHAGCARHRRARRPTFRPSLTTNVRRGRRGSRARAGCRGRRKPERHAQLTNLVLKGTIASTIPEFSVAVIADRNAEQKVYVIGDTVGLRCHPARCLSRTRGA